MFESPKKAPNENPLLNVSEVEIVYKSKVNTKDRLKISSSWQCYDLLMNVYDHNTIEHREYFWVMYLNQANKCIGAHMLSMGGLSSTVVDVRPLFQGALLANASNIIVSHNHPSGNLAPSSQDRNLTKKIKEAGELLDIKLLDHLIVSAHGYYSFADEGQI